MKASNSNGAEGPLRSPSIKARRNAGRLGSRTFSKPELSRIESFRATRLRHFGALRSGFGIHQFDP